MIQHIGKVALAVALFAVAAQADSIHISGTLHGVDGVITGGSLQGAQPGAVPNPFEIEVHGGMLQGSTGWLDLTFLLAAGPLDVHLDFSNAAAFRLAGSEALLFSLWGCPFDLDPPAEEEELLEEPLDDPVDEPIEELLDEPADECFELPPEPQLDLPLPQTSLQLLATDFTHAPEPASLFLVLGAGLAAAAIRRRRRASRA